MASFRGELRWRNVFKVGTAYAVVVWLPVFSLVSTSSLADEYEDVVIADAHVHLLDFLQNGDYPDQIRVFEPLFDARRVGPDILSQGPQPFANLFLAHLASLLTARRVDVVRRAE